MQGGIRDEVILLVEDSPDNELVTLRAVEENNVDGQVGIALDAVEGMAYLFATGEYEVRDITVMPQLIPLDLKLPKIDGPEVLGRCGTTSEPGSCPWSS